MLQRQMGDRPRVYLETVYSKVWANSILWFPSAPHRVLLEGSGTPVSQLYGAWNLSSKRGKGRRRRTGNDLVLWLWYWWLLSLTAISAAPLLLKTLSPTTDLDQTSLLTSQNWLSACISFQHVKGLSTLPDQCGAHREQPISETGI